MRTLLLAGALAVAGFAIATPISVAPASAQVSVDTPIGGVRVGPQPRYREGPTDMIADIADAALLRSSAMTDRSAGSAVAIRTGARTQLIGATRSVTASMAAASR